MTLRLPISGKRHATIVSAYAPTKINPDEVKDKFYDDLDSVISTIPWTDKLILLGDFIPPVVCSANRSKAVVPVLVLLLVALWFILRGDLLCVFPCVILFCVFQSF